jgi:conjugal transfer mating pair stabilization protein TraN
MKARRFVVSLCIVAWQAASGWAIGQTYPAGACTLVPNSRTCIDTTPCKPDSTGAMLCLAGATVPPGGLQLPQTCWHYSYQFACVDAATSTNTCTPYEKDPACGVISSSCQDVKQPSGTCDSWTYTYQCQTSPAQTTTQVSCTNGLFNTAQYPTPSNPNNTFALAAVASEMMREGQVYSDKGTNLFAGVKETCRKGYAGIQNCCGTSPGAQNDAQVSEVAFKGSSAVVKYVGEQAIDWASPYVFDAMYNNGLWTEAMTSAFETGADTFGTNLAGSGFTVGAYGFTYSSAGFVEGSGVMGANECVLGCGAGATGQFGVLEFNPYVFAAVVIMMVVQKLMACKPEEQLLSQHKGASLSVYVDTVCTSKVLGACVQYTDEYCSFNSVLAKIINTQGKAQLGLNAADCSGLSIQQVQSLDFTKIDFREFTTSVMANANAGMPSSGAMNRSYTPIMQSLNGGSAQSGTQINNSNITGGLPNTQPVAPNPNMPTYGP